MIYVACVTSALPLPRTCLAPKPTHPLWHPPHPPPAPFGIGGYICSLDPIPRLHRRRRFAAILFPLPNHQPSAQSSWRPLHRACCLEYIPKGHLSMQTLIRVPHPTLECRRAPTRCCDLSATSSCCLSFVSNHSATCHWRCLSLFRQGGQGTLAGG